MSKFNNLELKSLHRAPGFWELTADLIYIDGSFSYLVPRGFCTDLASIPRVLRFAFSKNGKSRRPAVCHDKMYTDKWKTRKECDKMFYRMLRDEDVGLWTARFYYWGVRLGGWTRGSW